MRFFDRILTNVGTMDGLGHFYWDTAAVQHALPPVGVDTYTTYTILDADGIAWETGRSTVTESVGTYQLSRNANQTVMASSNSGAAVTFSNSATHTLILTPDALHIESTAPLAARVELSATLTGQANTVIIPWTSMQFDDSNYFDSGGDTTRLTVPGAWFSRVSVVAGVALQNFAVDTAFQVELLHNGAVIATSSGDNSTSTVPAAVVSTGVISVFTNDYFQLRVTCTEASYDILNAGTFMAISSQIRPEF